MVTRLVVAFIFVIDATVSSLLIKTISVVEFVLLADTLNVVEFGSYVFVIVEVKSAPLDIVLLASATDNAQVALPAVY